MNETQHGIENGILESIVLLTFYLVLFGVLLDIDFPFSSRTVYIQMQTECLAKKKKYTRRQWNDCVF